MGTLKVKEIDPDYIGHLKAAVNSLQKQVTRLEQQKENYRLAASEYRILWEKTETKWQIAAFIAGISLVFNGILLYFMTSK